LKTLKFKRYFLSLLAAVTLSSNSYAGLPDADKMLALKCGLSAKLVQSVPRYHYNGVRGLITQHATTNLSATLSNELGSIYDQYIAASYQAVQASFASIKLEARTEITQAQQDAWYSYLSQAESAFQLYANWVVSDQGLPAHHYSSLMNAYNHEHCPGCAETLSALDLANIANDNIVWINQYCK